ncbi:hypothetical protein R1sor_005782 [Riccia sorocarpa]|uniref:Cytochrome b5 heme-binding domain-containing protein n=1 Tax=Riccia sorocarpa TaxID=122646 RepID=A0ABD3HML6_9MARC
MATVTTTITETFWSKWNTAVNLSLITKEDRINEAKAKNPISKDAITKELLTREEVSKHNNPKDCWIIINGKVYDVTNFGKTHPGGPVIFTQAGRDGTDAFKLFHPPRAYQQLKEVYIGDVHNDDPVPELLKDYRDLRTALQRAQMFKSNKLYYASKFATVFSLLAASLAIINWSQSFWAVLASSVVMGLYWQQCGWLSHDFVHNQVTDNKKLNLYFGGLVVGNLMTAFSVGWWRTKHNVHHAVTNECDEKYQPVDPDIDTVPLLAWSKEILDTVEDPNIRKILSVQHWLFFPLLLLARISWMYSSWAHARDFEMSPSMRRAEKGTLLAHYATTIGAAFYFLPAPQAICWLFLSEAFSGLFLSIVFTVSHNGMEMYNEPKDFVTAQLSATRNIKNQFFYDWFSGGLNWQIEHHLFPTMPRHNLGKVAPHVKALCAKHGLEYQEISLYAAMKAAFDRLAEVAALARASLQNRLACILSSSFSSTGYLQSPLHSPVGIEWLRI